MLDIRAGEKKMNKVTTTATDILAGMMHGPIDQSAYVVRESGLAPTERQLWEAYQEMQRAVAYGQAWQFRAATDSLSRAYAAIGAENPDTDVDSWHSGRHPIWAARDAA